MAAALPVASHPHVFVDTALRVMVDDAGRATGVEIAWSYDAFYSLLLMEDFNLDPDGDGTLTDAETAMLSGFDLNWIEGFEGDTYVLTEGVAVGLGRPQDRGATVKDGVITTRHYRAFDAPAPAAGLVVKAYDPTFYTAYTMLPDVDVTGACTATVTPADLDAAYTLLEELLYAVPASQAEEDFPQVGEAFSDKVTVSCDG